MIYLELLWEFMQIGLLSFGGGYAVLPLIEQNIVQEKGWMTAQQFVDVLTISEMTPGPISVNAATFVGNQLLGVTGGIVATIGVAFPSFFIVLILAFLYKRYQNLSVVQNLLQALRPAIVALIAVAGMTILLTAFFGTGSLPIALKDFNWFSAGIFLLSLYLMYRRPTSPIRIMLISGIFGLIIYSFV